MGTTSSCRAASSGHSPRFPHCSCIDGGVLRRIGLFWEPRRSLDGCGRRPVQGNWINPTGRVAGDREALVRSQCEGAYAMNADLKRKVIVVTVTLTLAPLTAWVAGGSLAAAEVGRGQSGNHPLGTRRPSVLAGRLFADGLPLSSRRQSDLVEAHLVARGNEAHEDFGREAGPCGGMIGLIHTSDWPGTKRTISETRTAAMRPARASCHVARGRNRPSRITTARPLIVTERKSITKSTGVPA